eukprot:TRINITY_DN770_c0_g1_i1.p1 TRINITY_DN770_c0_g1~~TRINITY_DN770_c0_g1_i1.p1  ORF type:complete len:423 (+),score=131.41 TRINITY_DN770_c0_g1_i1:88-1356(+)
MNISVSKSALLLAALFVCSSIAATCPSPLIVKSFSNAVNSAGTTTATVGVDVAGGYRLIGGGFTGRNVRESYVEATAPPVWVVTTAPVTASAAGPATTTVFAIGLYDPNNCYQVSYQTSAPAGVNAETGTASAVCPAGSTLVGGGARSDRFLVENYPNTIRGDATSASTWTASFASASGFVANSTTGITAYAICVTPTGTGYSLGNFINNAGPTAGANPASSSATVPYLLAGGGFRSNGLVDASYNVSGVWRSITGGYSTLGDGSSIQSVALGLSQSVSSSSAPTTSSTPAPANPTSAPTKSCVGQIVTTPRAASQGGSWVDRGTTYQIYDIGVKNTGNCPIIRATYDSLFTGPNSPGVSQKWNIGSSPSGDQILGSEISVYNGVAPGSTLNGAGAVVFNATGVTGVAKGPTVFCSATCTNA